MEVCEALGCHTVALHSYRLCEKHMEGWRSIKGSLRVEEIWPTYQRYVGHDCAEREKVRTFGRATSSAHGPVGEQEPSTTNLAARTTYIREKLAAKDRERKYAITCDGDHPLDLD